MEDKKYSKLKASFEATQPQMPADFTDRVMKRIEQPVARCCGLDPTEKRRTRWLPVSFIAAAACIALLFYVGGLRNTQHDETPHLVAQTDTAKTVPQTEPKKELPIEKGEMTTKQKVAEVKPRKARSVTAIPDTLGNDIWQSERNVVLAVQMLSECETSIRKGEQSVRNAVVEATYHAMPQPNTTLVVYETGDYQIVEDNQRTIIDI